MKVTVNGVRREVESAPLTPLLDVLRGELSIMSPKVGCESGGCGACTVLVGGAARRSCLLPVAMVEGLEVTTVEGLGSPDSLSAMQQAFHDAYAAQCGYCTSGMVIAATAYVAAGGDGERESAIEALAGHVCRCTGYVKILEAVQAAARGETVGASAEPAAAVAGGGA